jgi:hypothetical protein
MYSTRYFYPILTRSGDTRQFCVKSPILNILKICLGGDAQTKRRGGRTDMRKPKSLGQREENSPLGKYI